MRDIARRFVLTRRVAGAAAAALATVTTFAVLGAPSALAATSVTIKTSFEQSPISLNTSDAIGYALTNNTGAVETVTFTDNLPAGVTLDNPVGLTNTNGTGTCSFPTASAAAPGNSSVTLSVNVPSETTSGAVCTISFSVVAATPSSGDVPLLDSYHDVSAVITSTGLPAAAPTATASSTGLVVLADPTLSVQFPTANQTFALGQVFNAAFSCTAVDPLDSIDSFFGTDDEGNQIASGAPLDTVDPGTHSLEVDCYSAVGGGDVTQSVNYTVRTYKVTAVKSTKADHVSFKAALPAGKVVAEIIDGKKIVGTTRLKINAGKTVKLTVKPTTAGAKLLAATKGKKANVKLQVSFTPSPIGSVADDTQIVSSTAPIIVTKSLKVAVAQPAAEKKK